MNVVSLAYGDSLIHCLDPRGKIVAAVLFCGTIALADHFSILVMALCCGFFLVFLAKLPVAAAGKRLFVFNMFIFFVWLLIFTYPGQPIIKIGPVSITDEGIRMAGSITLKANAIFLVLTALLATISLTTIGQAMHQLGVPKKFVQILLFTYRYMHVLEKEFQRLWNAVAVRGFVPATTIHTYRTYAYLVGMLLLRSVDRAERIHDAMLCRGFNGRFYSLREFTMARRDLIFFSFLFFFMAGLWSIECLMLK
jgi:cobalt/nickel transport system permease protein